MTNDNEASFLRLRSRLDLKQDCSSPNGLECRSLYGTRIAVSGRTSHLQRSGDRSAHKRANYAYTLVSTKSWPALSLNSLSRAVLASLAWRSARSACAPRDRLVQIFPCRFDVLPRQPPVLPACWKLHHLDQCRTFFPISSSSLYPCEINAAVDPRRRPRQTTRSRKNGCTRGLPQ